MKTWLRWVVTSWESLATLSLGTRAPGTCGTLSCLSIICLQQEIIVANHQTNQKGVKNYICKMGQHKLISD